MRRIGPLGSVHFFLKLKGGKTYRMIITGIQYAKAMGFNVIGIDVAPSALEEAKAQGADHVFNPITDKDYVQQIKKITKKGVHAAINFTNSQQAYSSMPDVIRVNGIFMVVGIPLMPLPFKGIDLSLGRFRVKGACNGTTPILERAVKFSHEHGIMPHVEEYKLEQIHEMMDLMLEGKTRGRMAVIF